MSKLKKTGLILLISIIGFIGYQKIFLTKTETFSPLELAMEEIDESYRNIGRFLNQQTIGLELKNKCYKFDTMKLFCSLYTDEQNVNFDSIKKGEKYNNFVQLVEDLRYVIYSRIYDKQFEKERKLYNIVYKVSLNHLEETIEPVEKLLKIAKSIYLNDINKKDFENLKEEFKKKSSYRIAENYEDFQKILLNFIIGTEKELNQFKESLQSIKQMVGKVDESQDILKEKLLKNIINQNKSYIIEKDFKFDTLLKKFYGENVHQAITLIFVLNPKYKKMLGIPIGKELTIKIKEGSKIYLPTIDLLNTLLLPKSKKIEKYKNPFGNNK